MNSKVKKNKKRKTRFIITIGFVLIFTLFYKLAVYPVAVNLIKAEVKALQAEAIARAEQRLVYSQLYQDMYYYDKNNEGDITLIRSNTFLINQLNYLTTEQMQRELRNAASSGSIDVPLGVFLGNPLLLGTGPEVKLRVIGIGATNCRLHSEFLSQGINQTLHRHFIEVSTSIDVVISFKVETISQTVEILVAENLIVGKVPSAYLQGEQSPNFLDLLP